MECVLLSRINGSLEDGETRPSMWSSKRNRPWCRDWSSGMAERTEMRYLERDWNGRTKSNIDLNAARSFHA
jgi:hypothetical protein